jgi:hypothetical protein
MTAIRERGAKWQVQVRADTSTCRFMHRKAVLCEGLAEQHVKDGVACAHEQS